MFKVVSTAHWPSSGVNVYVIVPAVAVFIDTGFHLPVMPLVDVVGNAGAVAVHSQDDARHRLRLRTVATRRR